MDSFSFFNTLVGSDRKVEVSQDGRAINITGQVADGIPASITMRPSTSCGVAMDAKVDALPIKHIEGTPNF